MAGASIKEIQEAAGHKTITMSTRYSHLSPEHRQSVVERISGTGQTRTGTEEHNMHQNSHQPKTVTRSRRAKVA